jgi:hypothetical protein
MADSLAEAKGQYFIEKHIFNHILVDYSNIAIAMVAAGI